MEKKLYTAHWITASHVVFKRDWINLKSHRIRSKPMVWSMRATAVGVGIVSSLAATGTD